MYGWIFPAASGAFAALAILVNGPALLRQKNALEKHRERFEMLGSGLDTSRAERAIERTRAAFEAMPPLAERAKVAVSEIRDAVKSFDVRPARTAATLAAVSIRALISTLRAGS